MLWAGSHFALPSAAHSNLKPERADGPAAGDGLSVWGLDGSGQSRWGAAAGAYLGYRAAVCPTWGRRDHHGRHARTTGIFRTRNRALEIGL